MKKAQWSLIKQVVFYDLLNHLFTLTNPLQPSLRILYSPALSLFKIRTEIQVKRNTEAKSNELSSLRDIMRTLVDVSQYDFGSGILFFKQ